MKVRIALKGESRYQHGRYPVSRVDDIRRVRITYRGIVQGVGFRPALYRCAVDCGLTGFVQNRRSEVVAELQGSGVAIDRFEELVRERLPAPARIESVGSEEVALLTERGFRIAESSSSSYLFPPIPPDIALCEDCRRELLDPANRRYLYPFITCTECGPRYSIVEETPFDRERTSMADFRQCDACSAEYDDPHDRRFHSQTNSCPQCGPVLQLLTAEGRPVEGDPVVKAIEALGRGRVVALQGIGGFHLAADPRFPGAVERLRLLKSRRAKPFALMVRDLEAAAQLCVLSDSDREILGSPAAPIVILPAHHRAADHLSAVSDLGTHGIMLPYSPLHSLLFFHPDAPAAYRHLIMTSGNLGEEPIITDGEEARRRLAGSAELFLCHNRRILLPTDDSVMRPLPDGGYILVRRSRGFVPRMISLDERVGVPTLAAGSDLKSAPALARDATVLVAPHLGDLSNQESRAAYVRTVETMQHLFPAAPERIVFDLHPGYYCSEWARASAIPQKIALQHHYAHILSVMAEHGLKESIGVAFDGTGFGSDGTIWGGEFLYATRREFRRLGSFRAFALPGGDAAIRRPARIAFSLLYEGRQSGRIDGTIAGIDASAADLLGRMIDQSINVPMTSSAGRLFDAAASLLGLVGEVSYEG
ncbi:carbamoyltransferase HypF, partial [Salinispira pacifica]